MSGCSRWNWDEFGRGASRGGEHRMVQRGGRIKSVCKVLIRGSRSRILDMVVFKD